MGVFSTITNSIVLTIAFYAGLALLINLHNFSVPDIAFSPEVLVTVFIYMAVLLLNYKI